MSQENVEVVRAHFATWNAGDMTAHRELYDPNVVARMPERWPEPGPFVGREHAIRQATRLREAFDADELQPLSDFIDIGDRVVVRFIWHGVGRGPAANQEVTGIYTVRLGRIIRLEFFWDHAAALEAVGLSE
jgi:ketosteroid isomerase-like protein